jgi:hypothetical protein
MDPGASLFLFLSTSLSPSSFAALRVHPIVPAQPTPYSAPTSDA